MRPVEPWVTDNGPGWRKGGGLWVDSMRPPRPGIAPCSIPSSLVPRSGKPCDSRPRPGLLVGPRARARAPQSHEQAAPPPLLRLHERPAKLCGSFVWIFLGDQWWTRSFGGYATQGSLTFLCKMRPIRSHPKCSGLQRGY